MQDVQAFDLSDQNRKESHSSRLICDSVKCGFHAMFYREIYLASDVEEVVSSFTVEEESVNVLNFSK